MKLYITEKDFQEIGIDVELEGKDELVENIADSTEQDNKIEETIMESLPKVISNKIRKLWANLDGYEIEGIKMKINVSGKPFGCGLGGEIELEYKKK